MKFGREKELEIFRALAVKSQYQVGLEFGFDKVYPNARSIRNAVTNIYTRVKNNATEYGLSPEVVSMVETGMKTRALSHVINKPPMSETSSGPLDIKELVTGVRDKAFRLIDKKLDRVSNSKKRLDAISFKDLGTIAGISFDKTQILRGEATEHVALMGKIDTTISPEEALKLALQMRDKTVEVKNS